MKIKTLAEILAESDSDSASSSDSKRKSPKRKKSSKATNYANKLPTQSNIEYLDSKRCRSSKAADIADINGMDNINDSSTYESFTSPDSSTTHYSPKPSTAKAKKPKKRFHPAANFTAESIGVPAYQSPEPQSIKEMLAEIKHESGNEQDDDSANSSNATTTLLEPNLEPNSETSSDNEADNLPSALKAYLRTPEQRQAEVDAIKAESRLRWLAFYYLSRREYGKAELKQKLIDKEQDPFKIDTLLEEFESKGYQSDYRTTLMLIRESIRKGRGRGRIKQEFYRKKISMPSNIDELIDMANAESDEFSEFIDGSSDSLVEGVDWLKLAVSARIKKYGDDIPTEPKAKAKQLRFLQYRGFNTDICFQALNYTLDNLDERF